MPQQALALVGQMVSERTALLLRTEPKSKTGEFEPFKTSGKYDGTARNPHWLEEARL